MASSTYGSTIFQRSPAEGPASAFDGDPSTIWVASVANDSVGQWVSINFGRSVRMSTITVTPLDDGRDRPRVERLRITTQRGTVERNLAPGEKPQTLRVPAGPSRWMRLTLDRVASPAVNTDLVGAGLRDVAIPGVHFEQALEVPSDETTAFARPGASVPTYVFNAPENNVRFHLGLANPVETHLIRSITVPRAAMFEIDGNGDTALRSRSRCPPAAIGGTRNPVRPGVRQGSAGPRRRCLDPHSSDRNLAEPAVGIPARGDVVFQRSSGRWASPRSGRRRRRSVPIHEPGLARRCCSRAADRPHPLSHREGL